MVTVRKVMSLPMVTVATTVPSLAVVEPADDATLYVALLLTFNDKGTPATPCPLPSKAVMVADAVWVPELSTEIGVNLI
jgi:hypothetical protein